MVIRRVALVGFVHLLLFELLCQLSVHWRESSEERALMGQVVLLVAGLTWAALPAFKERRLRVLFRAGSVLVLFLGAHAATYAYAWHVRPNVGLYQEPDWVAANPSFRERLRERIERNRW